MGKTQDMPERGNSGLIAGAAKAGLPAALSLGGMPSWLLSVGGGLTLFAVLEIIPQIGLVNPAYWPPATKLLASLFHEILPSAEFWLALGSTLLTWAIGLAIAMLGGVSLGLLIGSVDFLNKLTTSTVEFLRPIPSVALIPLVMLVFGLGREATLALVIYASFWQIFIQVSYGVRDVDPVARDTASVYRFRRWSIIRNVVWPTTLPYALTGFRLAASVALILTLTGELIIGTYGLGRLIITAEAAGNTAAMYALIFVTGILGVLVNQFARWFERRALKWHPSVRLETVG